MPRMASPDMIDLAGSSSSDEESSRSGRRSGSPALLSPRPTPPQNRKRAAHPSPALSTSSSPSLSPTSASGEDGEDDRNKMSRREQKREEKREALARAKKWSDERKRAAKIDRKISASDRRRGNGGGAGGTGGGGTIDLMSPSSPSPGNGNVARGAMAAAAGATAGASTPTPRKMTKEEKQKEKEEARKRARRWHQGRRTNRGLFSESDDEGPEEVLSLSSSSEHVESPTRASAAEGARAFAAARTVTDDDVVNLASPPAASGGGSAWPPPPQTLHNIRWAPPPIHTAARSSTARATAGRRTSNGGTPSSHNNDAATTRSAGVRISTQDMQQFRSNVARSSAAASASRRSSSSGGESNDHSRPGRQWACPQCTLLNSPYQSRCGACYQRNPSLPSLQPMGGRNNNAAGGRAYDVDGDGTFVPEGRPGILRTNRPAFPSAARTSAIDAAARGYRTDPVRDMLVQSLAGGGGGGGWGRPRGGPYTADLLRRMQQMQAAGNVDGMSYERLLELFGDGGDHRGASPSTIASLPVSRITDPEREIPEDRRECAICLEDFECGDERTSLPCLHGFHKGCVNRWLSSNGTCPVCKTSVRGGSGSG